MLYSSQLLFRRRLYADLETVLYHVHLFKPLSLLMKQASLYIRNTVPQTAFQALTRCGPRACCGEGSGLPALVAAMGGGTVAL